MALPHPIEFFRSYMREPNVVGAVTPSSRALAAAICEPFRRFEGPARVLEVGAGTGPITRYLGTILDDDDELDICEIQPVFARILSEQVLTNPDFAPRVAAGRVRLYPQPVQSLPYESRYDFVISGLPLTAFELPLVEQVFAVIRRALKPGGVVSYFEYVGLRRLSRALAIGKKRARIREVSSFLTDNIRRHQFQCRTILRNLPPAHARHLRFSAEKRSAATRSS